MRGKLIGRDKFMAKLGRLSGPEAVRIAGAVVYEGIDHIRAEADHSISRGSSSQGRHTPSAPGQPPNRDIGHLQNNLEAEMTGPVEGEVRSKAEYAAALEYGTSKMDARPYMRPARDKMVPKINKKFADAIGKLVDKA